MPPLRYLYRCFLMNFWNGVKDLNTLYYVARLTNSLDTKILSDSFLLKQEISEPTGICTNILGQTSNSSLAVVNHYLSDFNTRTWVMYLGLSDHRAIDLTYSENELQQKITRNLSYQRINNIIMELSNVVWRNVHENNDVNDTFDWFLNTFLEIFNA